MLKIKYSFTETPRVYYTAKGKHHLLWYCMQQDYSEAQAKKYERREFNLYLCTREGEPNYRVDMSHFNIVDMPKGNEKIEVDLRRFSDVKRNRK